MTTRWLWVIVPVILLGLSLAVEIVQAEPPVIKRYIPPLEMREGDELLIDLEDFDGGVVFEDPEGTGLTYGASSDGDILVIIEGSLVAFTGAPDFVGCESDIVIWAEDADGERSEYMSLFFTVHGPDRVPHISDFEPVDLLVSTPEDEAITFRVLDVENLGTDDWRIEWSADGFRGTVLDSGEFSFPDQSDADAVHNASGTYVVRAEVLVEGYEYYLTSMSWRVAVLDVNRPPVITYLTGDQVLTRGDDVHLQVVAHDPDLDDLSFRWCLSREFVQFDEVGASDQVVYPNDLAPGRHHFLCEVSDGIDISVSAWVNVTIVEMDGPGPLSPWCVATPIMSAISMILVIWWTARKGCS
jgi:hypothetical protein